MLICRSGARNTNYRLHAFADCLRVVFNSNQAAAPGLPPAHLGYKVHVHMEKSKVCCASPAVMAYVILLLLLLQLLLPK